MGPPPLALWLIVDEVVYRRLQAEAVMRQEGVVINQPVGQFAVKADQVMEQFILVIVNKLLLDGAVEAFDMGVYRSTTFGTRVDCG